MECGAYSNEHMMTINFDTIANNYEVIYVIITVMKYYLKKIDTSFHKKYIMHFFFQFLPHIYKY
jgi:hypothetical protein